MDIYTDKRLSALEMDDEDCNIFLQWQMANSFNDFITQDITNAPMGVENNQNLMILNEKECLSSDSYYSSLTSFDHSRADQQLQASNMMTTNPDEQVITRSSTSSTWSRILSFGNTGSPPLMNPENFQGFVSNNVSGPCENQNYAPKAKSVNKRIQQEMSTTTAQDHIMAERRRREKLSQKFIALSAIVPDLKKMDKASVLGDAIKYLKQLQERVNSLEEETKKRTVQSAVYVNKSQVTSSIVGDDSSSSDEDQDLQSINEEALPEIEARVSDKNVLIRIHCKKNNGVIGNVVDEIEKLHLSVLNSSALPFGKHAMDITIVAQMEKEYSLKVKDLVKNLRLAFLKFM